MVPSWLLIVCSKSTETVALFVYAMCAVWVGVGCGGVYVCELRQLLSN